MHIFGSVAAAGLLTAGALILSCTCGSAAHSAGRHAPVSANLNKQFTIVVESNPTTGYSWSADFDKSRLRLESSSYERPAEPIPGSGGKQVFVFVPIKEGKTEVVLQYRRSWEKVPVKKRTYKVLVSP
ncbi:MAG: protease inhibitor I42 family protein [Pseudomonadota bacterium]